MQIRMLREIDSIFQGVPQSRKTLEAKEEMLQNLMEKYNDLCAQGKSEEAAFQIAIGSIGDITDLLTELNGGVAPTQTYIPQAATVPSYDSAEIPAEEYAAYTPPVNREAEEQHNRALLVTVAVMMYIISPLALVLFPWRFGLVILFAMIAAATGLLIYKGMTSPGKSQPMFPPDEDEDTRKKGKLPKSQRRFYSSLSSALWMVTIAIYFLISFSTNSWAVSWIIFLIAAAANNLLKAFLDLYNRR